MSHDLQAGSGAFWRSKKKTANHTRTPWTTKDFVLIGFLRVTTCPSWLKILRLCHYFHPEWSVVPRFVRCAPLRGKMPWDGTKVACRELQVRLRSKAIRGEDSLFRNCLHESPGFFGPASVKHSATRSFFAENLRPVRAADGSGIALTGSSHARSCVLPRLPEQVLLRFPISDFRTD